MMMTAGFGPSDFASSYFFDEWSSPTIRGGHFGPGFPPIGAPPDPDYLLMRGPPPQPPPPPKKHLKRADYHVIARHKAIYPSEEALSFLLDLTERTQAALERASIALDGLVDFDNRLVGGSKVGAVAKGLLLEGDNTANLVVMCEQYPTVVHLRKVREHTERELLGSDAVGNVAVSVLEDEAGFSVTAKKTSNEEEEEEEEKVSTHSVIVTLTSTVVRDEARVMDSKVEQDSDGETPENDLLRLPKER